MSNATFFKYARIAVFALCLAVLSISSVFAQNNTGGGTTGGTTTTRTDRDDNTDWGWIGLLGLAGLAGLLRRNTRDVHHDTGTRNN